MITLISHVVKRHMDSLRSVSYVNTFNRLHLRYEQEQDRQMGRAGEMNAFARERQAACRREIKGDDLIREFLVYPIPFLVRFDGDEIRAKSTWKRKRISSTKTTRTTPSNRWRQSLKSVRNCRRRNCIASSPASFPLQAAAAAAAPVTAEAAAPASQKVKEE